MASGRALKVKKARTKINGARNWSLRSACDLLKAEASTKGKAVSIDWKERVVQVNSEIVFKQDKDERTGTFTSAFAHLRMA